MHNFKIGDNEYKLAEEWKEVNLQQWCDFVKYCEEKQEELGEDIFGLQDSFDQLDQAFNTVRIFSNCPEDELGKLEEMEILLLNALLGFLVTPCPKFESDHFYIGDVLYVSHKQNEDKVEVREKLTLGKIQRTPGFEKKHQHLPYALAILIRPGTEGYNTEFKRKEYTRNEFNQKDLNERAELFLRELTADKFFDHVNFLMSLKSV